MGTPSSSKQLEEVLDVDALLGISRNTSEEQDQIHVNSPHEPKNYEDVLMEDLDETRHSTIQEKEEEAKKRIEEKDRVIKQQQQNIQIQMIPEEVKSEVIRWWLQKKGFNDVQEWEESTEKMVNQTLKKLRNEHVEKLGELQKSELKIDYLTAKMSMLEDELSFKKAELESNNFTRKDYGLEVHVSDFTSSAACRKRDSDPKEPEKKLMMKDTDKTGQHSTPSRCQNMERMSTKDVLKIPAFPLNPNIPKHAKKPGLKKQEGGACGSFSEKKTQRRAREEDRPRKDPPLSVHADIQSSAILEKNLLCMRDLPDLGNSQCKHSKLYMRSLRFAKDESPPKDSVQLRNNLHDRQITKDILDPGDINILSVDNKEVGYHPETTQRAQWRRYQEERRPRKDPPRFTCQQELGNLSHLSADMA